MSGTAKRRFFDDRPGHAATRRGLAQRDRARKPDCGETVSVEPGYEPLRAGGAAQCRARWIFLRPPGSFRPGESAGLSSERFGRIPGDADESWKKRGRAAGSRRSADPRLSEKSAMIAEWRE